MTSILLIDNKIITATNTDNMGKLFVTVFAFLPACLSEWPSARRAAVRQACTVTVFWLKNTGRGRCCRRVTQPPHIAGPLGANFRATELTIRHLTNGHIHKKLLADDRQTEILF